MTILGEMDAETASKMVNRCPVADQNDNQMNTKRKKRYALNGKSAMIASIYAHMHMNIYKKNGANDAWLNKLKSKCWEFSSIKLIDEKKDLPKYSCIKQFPLHELGNWNNCWSSLKFYYLNLRYMSSVGH